MVFKYDDDDDDVDDDQMVEEHWLPLSRNLVNASIGHQQPPVVRSSI